MNSKNMLYMQELVHALADDHYPCRLCVIDYSLQYSHRQFLIRTEKANAKLHDSLDISWLLGNDSNIHREIILRMWSLDAY